MRSNREMNRRKRETTKHKMKTIHIEQGTASGLFSGDGSIRNPFMVSTAEDVDRIFLHGYTNSTKPVRYAFGAGVFPFSGSWAMERQGYAHLRPGDQLIGSGMGVTTLKLTNPVMLTNGKKRPDVHGISVGDHRGSDFIATSIVRDLTIDGNFAEHGADVFVTSGLRVYEGTAIIENVQVVGLCGSPVPVQMPDGKRIGLEAFGISFQYGSGHIARNCVVSKCASHAYLSAFSSCAGSALHPNRFVDCVADGGVGNHAAFTVYSNTVLVGCRGGGFQHGIYNDTERVESVEAHRCHLWVSRVGIGLVAVGENETKRDIKIDQCRFHFPSGDGECIGVELFDKRLARTVPAFWDIQITNSEFTKAGTPVPFYIATANGPVSGILIRQAEIPEVTKTNFRGSPSDYVIDWIRTGLKSATVERLAGSL